MKAEAIQQTSNSSSRAKAQQEELHPKVKRKSMMILEKFQIRKQKAIKEGQSMIGQ